MRKNLFINSHPLDGVASKNIGLKMGKAFYDLNKQELEYKESDWRVKANFGGNNLFNLKMKIGAKTKGTTRSNVQFGTDQSHFGSDNKSNKLSAGGMFALGVADIRLKVFNDKAAEVFMDASVGGAQIGCDLRVTEDQSYKGFIGASYGLPSSIPMLKNVHVGSIVSLPDMRSSLGLFGEAPLPSMQKASVGLEYFADTGALLAGTELALDAENSIIAKAGDNGIAQVSLVKKFKGIDLRMGIEANLFDRSLGRFGTRIVLKQ